ncbi:histidine kinase [Candidatus Desulfofervidus auxilii]|nr:CBS domain-containing protein [Candidatus Desulfofervidus auxilii]AMM40925.1 histidine kinase [Candidatus Desulfofervidus auxilii]CAD7775321.1 Inosine-5'-monophosphate dehydrogenase [Candidatus Methanoperedenaceae archaeon GB50]CAD7776844.1 Inosine-5'-monophosphate dehydrogenase [Candidatus Methanoperedenaceae archaeon GB37]
MKKIQEIMVREIEEISPNAKVSEAIALMLKEGIRSLVVTPETGEDVYGIVTVRNVVFKVLAKGLEPKNIEVREIATKPLVCIDAHYDVSHAVRLMANLNLARLVVTELGKIVGIVTLMDILRSSQGEKIC